MPNRGKPTGIHVIETIYGFSRVRMERMFGDEVIRSSLWRFLEMFLKRGCSWDRAVHSWGFSVSFGTKYMWFFHSFPFFLSLVWGESLWTGEQRIVREGMTESDELYSQRNLYNIYYFKLVRRNLLLLPLLLLNAQLV